MAHILLVEDDVDSRDALRFLLEHSGHRVSVAGGGREAIALAASLEPDWAVIDIGLPDIDGYEAARGVRRSAPSIRLVALTGYGRSSRRADATFGWRSRARYAGGSLAISLSRGAVALRFAPHSMPKETLTWPVHPRW